MRAKHATRPTRTADANRFALARISHLRNRDLPRRAGADTIRRCYRTADRAQPFKDRSRSARDGDFIPGIVHWD
jgi:hypothetical protein